MYAKPMCVSAVSTQDKVVASRLPNHWALKSIFITGIVYGLYLTLSSWCLYYVATHTSFFREKLKMHDLRYKPDSYLAEWCLSDNNPNRNVSLPEANASSLGHGQTAVAMWFAGLSTQQLEPGSAHGLPVLSALASPTCALTC